MTQETRWDLVAAVAVVTLVAVQQDVWAAAGTGSGFYLEDTAVKIFNMCKNVIMPLVILGMIVFCAGNIAFGWCQMGPGLGRLLIGGAVLAGGIQTLLLIVGGQVATALVLP